MNNNCHNFAKRKANKCDFHANFWKNIKIYNIRFEKTSLSGYGAYAARPIKLPIATNNKVDKPQKNPQMQQITLIDAGTHNSVICPFWAYAYRKQQNMIII